MQKIFKKQALKTKQISKKKSDSMNILFVMADSLSPHDLGCYGNSCALTPNIDKLAKSGVLFNRAYCNSPLSAPSRASMVTGRYCSELNVFDNANEFRGDIPTIGNVLQLANYETVICGKMHFIGYDQYHGFNQRLALETDYSQSYDPNAFRFAYDWERNGRNPDGPIYMAGSYVALPRWDNHPVNGHYDRDQTIHQKALEYLSEKDANSDPFFCCVSYHTPHNPFWIPEKYKSSFRGKQLPFPENAISTHGIMDDWLNEFHHVIDCRDQLMQKESIRWLYETYYGMVNYLDCLIGELVAAIDRQGLRDNTVIVFASDHGDMLCHRGMVQKRYFYERSVRVPLIFVLPHQLRRGVRSDELVSLLDITPTFAELVKTSCYDVRGNSLVPLMTSVYSMGDRMIFCEYHGEGVHAPCFMVRHGDYKYIYVDGYEERLYNVADDPQELHLLSCQGRNKSIMHAMKKELLSQFDPHQIAISARQSQHDRQFIFNSWQASQKWFKKD